MFSVNKSTALLIGCSSIAIACPAFAQSSDASPSQENVRDSADAAEIIVTARRREEAFSDVPSAGTILSDQDLIDQGGLITLQDLANNLPSVNFANTGTPSTSEISMRGSATARATNAEGAVGLYRNGTYVGGGRIGGRTFTRMDFFDLQRIEVLRGVQGALYGRNAVGGSLNLINVRPSFESTGFASASFASNERYEFQSAINLALSDTVAVRIGGDLMEQNSGDFFNTFTDEWRDKQSARGVRGQLRFSKERLDFNILAEISSADLPPLIFNLNLDPGGAFPNGIVQDPYSFGWNGASIAEQKQHAIIANLDYDLGIANFSSSISIRRRKTRHGFDADGVDPEFLAVLRAGGGGKITGQGPGGLRTNPDRETLQEDDTDTFYAEAHLTDSGNKPFQWLLGYEHLELRSDSLFTNTRASNPTLGDVSPAELDTISNAVFGSLGYNFTERFNITGEARSTFENKSLIADRFDIVTGNSLGTNFDLDTRDSESNFSYTFIASYKMPSISGLLYAKHGTAFRAGGFNTDVGDPGAPNPVTVVFNNEDATAYELGFKGDPFPWLYVQGAIFRTDTDNILVQDTNGCTIAVSCDPPGNISFLRNGGKGRVQGFELEANTRFNVLGGRLRLSGAVSHNDAKIVSGIDAGKIVPQVANWTYNARFNYSHAGPFNSRLFTNVIVFRRTGGVQEISQDPDLVDYTDVDARAGLRVDGFELAVFSDNLLDNRYRLNSGAAAERFNRPRTFGVELSKRW